MVPLESGPPELLLARGLELLDGLAQDPTPRLRWYRATSPALVVGRGQPLPPDTGDLPVVQRHSGGGAVLMDAGLLSCDVLLPAGHELLDGDLAAVFVPVGRAWADGLRDLGVHDLEVHEGPGTARRRGTPREQLLAAVCYATVGRGEVLAGGRKVVGLAQRRRRPGALVQCGLLRRWEPARLLASLGADPGDRDILERAVGLDELLQPAPSDETVIAAVERHLEGYIERQP